MKRSLYFAICSAILLFNVIACEFSPSEIPLTELVQPSADNIPGIWIELTPEMDTLRVSSPVWVTFRVQTGEHQLYDVKFHLDDELVNTNYGAENQLQYYIPVESLKDGFHELKITTYTATNSGSIADKTGNEAYWYELRWPVYVNKQAKENFKLKEPVAVPQGLQISWPLYLYADFDRYVFSRTYNFNQKISEDITNPHLHSYIDKSYVEGIYANYSVALYSSGWDFRVDDVTYHQEIKKPEVVVHNDGTVDLSWERSKNEQQVKLYCIQTSAPNYGLPEEHDLEDLTRTAISLDEKIGFGADYLVRLRYIPTWCDSYHSALNTAGGLATIALGDSVPRFQQAFLSTAEQSLILYNGGTFSKYHPSTGESSAAVSVTPTESNYLWTATGSPDGHYFGHFSDKSYVIRRGSDLTVVRNMDIDAYNGFNLILSSVSLSNNGLIGVTDHNNNLKLFDTGTGKKVFERHFEPGYFLRRVMLSPDGRNLAMMVNDYGLGTTSLIYYSFDGNQISEMGRVHDVGKDVSEVLMFSPQSENKLVVSRWHSMYTYHVEVRDSRTFELLHRAEIPNMFVPVAYDFATDQVIAQYKFFPVKKHSWLVNAATGSQRKAVQLVGAEPLVFTGGQLYSGNGRTIGIDNFIIE